MFLKLHLSTCHTLSTPSQETFENILAHLDVRDLFAFGASCHKFRDTRDAYFSHRVLRTIVPYNLFLPSFLTTLRQTGAVISGSLVLSLLLPADSLTWELASLDIFVLDEQSLPIHAFLLSSGYTNQPIVRPQIPSAMRLQVSSLRVYSFQHRTIKLFSSLSPHSITPIVHAPLTCLLNFISGSSIYILYPGLTLNSISLINPFLTYQCSFKRDVLSFLSKYNNCGFSIRQCASIHHYPSPCKTAIRHVSDPWSLRFSLSPSLSSVLPIHCIPSGEDHVIWKLGGCGCTKQNRLVWPYVRTRYKPVRSPFSFCSTLLTRRYLLFPFSFQTQIKNIPWILFQTLTSFQFQSELYTHS